jgi:hypothetical protein
LQWRDVTALGLSYAAPPKSQFTLTLEPRSPLPHPTLRRVHVVTLVVPSPHMYAASTFQPLLLDDDDELSG